MKNRASLRHNAFLKKNKEYFNKGKHKYRNSKIISIKKLSLTPSCYNKNHNYLQNTIPYNNNSTPSNTSKPIKPAICINLIKDSVRKDKNYNLKSRQFKTRTKS